MHSTNDLYAVLVSAEAFELIDPTTGIVVASLSVLLDTFQYASLEMSHNDPDASNSSLRWTIASASQSNVQLRGPTSASGATDKPPMVKLSQYDSGPSTEVRIDSGRPDGAAAGRTAYTRWISGNAGTTYRESQSDNNADANDSWDLYSGSFNFFRGKIQGISRDVNALGANAYITAGGTIFATLAAITPPVAGAFAVVVATLDMVCLVQGDVVRLQIQLDAVDTGAAALFQFVGAAPPVNSRVHLMTFALIPLTAAAHTIRAVAYSNVNNTWAAQAANSTVQAIYFQ